MLYDLSVKQDKPLFAVYNQSITDVTTASDIQHESITAQNQFIGKRRNAAELRPVSSDNKGIFSPV